MAWKAGSPEKAYEHGYLDAKKQRLGVLQELMGERNYNPPSDYPDAYEAGWDSGRAG